MKEINEGVAGERRLLKSRTYELVRRFVQEPSYKLALIGEKAGRLERCGW